MYHVISGRHVFPGNTPVERLGKRINGIPTPLGELVELPPGLGAVMDRLITNRPRDRYQTAEEAAEALERLLPGRSNHVRAASIAAEPAADATAEHRVVQVEVEVEPDYPGWFRPLAELAESSPVGAAIALMLGALAFFGVGFFSAFLLLKR
jgi:serine/threonine-protein kinase